MKPAGAPLLALLLLTTGGCSESQPVARLGVAPAVIRLPYPQFSSLSLEWSPLVPRSELGKDPVVFVHLIDEPGSVLRTFDHPLPRKGWRRGEPLAYDLILYQSALGPPLPPGQYRLTVGLYNRPTHRWPLQVKAPEIAHLEYAVAVVETPDEDGQPRFSFAGGWKPVEISSDVQVLGRRWLSGEGSILVQGLPDSALIRLGLRIPSASEGTLVIEEGAGVAGVELNSECAESETWISGPGLHELEILLMPSSMAPNCEIHVRPDFYMIPSASSERVSVRLELLSWAPG